MITARNEGGIGTKCPDVDPARFKSLMIEVFGASMVENLLSPLDIATEICKMALNLRNMGNGEIFLANNKPDVYRICPVDMVPLCPAA